MRFTSVGPVVAPLGVSSIRERDTALFQQYSTNNKYRLDSPSQLEESRARSHDPAVRGSLEDLSFAHLATFRQAEPCTPRGVQELMRSKFVPSHMCGSGAILYNLPERPTSVLPLSRPLKVAFLTSIRDVGVEERVGSFGLPGVASSYVRGTIETALEAIKDDRLGSFAEVVAIITDDMPKDLAETGYTADPSRPGAWIFPRHVRNGRGELATACTVNIPSTFRTMRTADVAGRREQKLEFETKVHEVFRQSGADVLISDHYMARIDFLIQQEYHGLLGRVLNTHPGITRQGYQYRTLGGNPYDLMRLHSQGFSRLGDNSLMPVPPHDRGGASFHFITAGIDLGPVLCDGELTQIWPDDSDEVIAQKLYRSSKYHVFIEGLRHFASNFFPLVRGQY